MTNRMKPKKKWGQNFLRNRGAVDKIVTTIDAQPDEVVLEIGPGEGVLTEKLIELPNRLIAIEIDPDLFARLQSRFGDRIELRNEDAVDAELPSSTFRAVGNLPYNVGTPILGRVIAGPLDREQILAAMQRANIDAEARAETLTLQQFDALRTEMSS